jgi:hypothetical protein
MKELVERAKKPTPRFFKKLRSLGLVAAAVGGAILTAPVALPGILTSIAGYLVATGSVVSAVSQVTKEE